MAVVVPPLGTGVESRYFRREIRLCTTRKQAKGLRCCGGMRAVYESPAELAQDPHQEPTKLFWPPACSSCPRTPSMCSGIVHLHNRRGLAQHGGAAPPHRQVETHSHSLIFKLWRHGIASSVQAHRMRR